MNMAVQHIVNTDLSMKYDLLLQKYQIFLMSNGLFYYRDMDNVRGKK